MQPPAEAGGNSAAPAGGNSERVNRQGLSKNDPLFNQLAQTEWQQMPTKKTARPQKVKLAPETFKVKVKKLKDVKERKVPEKKDSGASNSAGGNSEPGKGSETSRKSSDGWSSSSRAALSSKAWCEIKWSEGFKSEIKILPPCIS